MSGSNHPRMTGFPAQPVGRDQRKTGYSNNFDKSSARFNPNEGGVQSRDDAGNSGGESDAEPVPREARRQRPTGNRSASQPRLITQGGEVQQSTAYSNNFDQTNARFTTTPGGNRREQPSSSSRYYFDQQFNSRSNTRPSRPSGGSSSPRPPRGTTGQTGRGEEEERTTPRRAEARVHVEGVTVSFGGGSDTGRGMNNLFSIPMMTNPVNAIPFPLNLPLGITTLLNPGGGRQ